MSRLVLLTAASLVCAMPAFAQHPDHPAQLQPATAPEGHDEQPTPSGRGSDRASPADMEVVDPPEAGNGVPPDAPTDHAADAFFPRVEMERARRILDEEHGGGTVSKVMLNELEYMGGDNVDGYRWDGQAWYGGDIDRLVLKSKGEGVDALESAELQVLYSRAIGPYTDVQLGVRHDIEPDPSRSYLAVGFESLLPYWFDVEGGVFLGQRGQVLGRLEGSLDFMLTQRLVLQPSAELNFAAKDDAGIGLGSGLSDAEVGLRLRYEIQREFAPYIGVLWERKFGATADFVRAAGEDPDATRIVAGIRAWF